MAVQISLVRDSPQRVLIPYSSSRRPLPFLSTPTPVPAASPAAARTGITINPTAFLVAATAASGYSAALIRVA